MNYELPSNQKSEVRNQNDDGRNDAFYVILSEAKNLSSWSFFQRNAEMLRFAQHDNSDFHLNHESWITGTL